MALLMTQKQIAILTVVKKGMGDGRFVDMDTLLTELPYKTSKESLQCSIRVLEKHGVIERKPLEKRGKVLKRTIALTPNGYHLMTAN